jgi:cytochrome c-type biogenesis protein CcmH/NrfG
VSDDSNQCILTELRLLRRTSNIALVVCVALVVGVAIYLPVRYSSGRPAQTQSDSWEAVRTAIDHIEYDKASAIAERILKRYPNDYYGYASLGGIALAADRIDEAERHFARAYELLPSEENEKMLRAVRKRIETEKPVVTQ